MIVLGLGSNIGDRLGHLRLALKKLQQHADINVHHVSPVYESDAMLTDSAPSDWNKPFFNVAISCKTVLTPTALLAQLQQIEKAMGRVRLGAWSPRCIDIDILVWGELRIKSDELVVPHAGLLERPFALWPLADLLPQWRCPRRERSAFELTVEWGSRFSGEAPFHTRQTPFRIDTPELVGIVNVTDNSFSDGNQFNTVELAVAQVETLFSQGAEVIDIGAESTRPHVAPVSAEHEWERLCPVLSVVMEQYKNNHHMPKISIDTRHFSVAEKAIAMGVDWINDVTGFTDVRMQDAVLDARVKLVCMHHITVPPSGKTLPQVKDPVREVYRWGEQQLSLLQERGIAKERLIFDPGVGFGKCPWQDIMLMQRASEFKVLGVPILFGHSRKSFHSMISPVSAKDRDVETSIFSLDLCRQKVDYLRLHNIDCHARAIQAQACLDSLQKEIIDELP